MADFMFNTPLLLLTLLSLMFSLLYWLGETGYGLTFGAVAIIGWYVTGYFWLMTVTVASSISMIFYAMGVIITVQFIADVIGMLRGVEPE